MQELEMISRVLLTDSDLPENLWAEAMFHSKRLRNRLMASRIDGRTPLSESKPNTCIDLTNLPNFGQQGHAFLYRSATTQNKKFIAHPVHTVFIAMQSDFRLCGVYKPSAKSIIIVGRNEFKVCETECLPSVTTLLDGISLQYERELIYQQATNEEGLHQAFLCDFVRKAYHSTVKQTSDPCIPRTFIEAQKSADGGRPSTGNTTPSSSATLRRSSNKQSK